MTDQAIEQVRAHLQTEVDRANSRADALRDALDELKHGTELKGWAIDRAIRIAEVNKQTVTFDALKELADQLVEYSNDFARAKEVQ